MEFEERGIVVRQVVPLAHSTEAEALRAEIVAAGGRAALLQADVDDQASECA
jgi:hypothetical protein